MSEREWPHSALDDQVFVVGQPVWIRDFRHYQVVMTKRERAARVAVIGKQAEVTEKYDEGDCVWTLQLDLVESWLWPACWLSPTPPGGLRNLLTRYREITHA